VTWHAAGERSFVEIDRGPIEYELTVGDPDLAPVVFLHEGLGSIDLWRGFPEEVHSAVGSPTTLVYARHGYGRSAPAMLPRPVSYMHREADVVLPALLDGLGVERPLLVGHSDGASIALLYAGAGGDVSGIVALAPHVFVEDETVAGIEAARTTFETTDLAAKLARYHDDPAATFRGWNDVWLSEGFRHWNIEDRLPGIVAPVLLVQGTADDYGTLAQLDAIERGVRGRCERLVIDGGGHAPHLDARADVVAVIAEFATTVNRPV
jgi:pimeloyl-ACP methyl ester carboxylesterase